MFYVCRADRTKGKHFTCGGFLQKLPEGKILSFGTLDFDRAAQFDCWEDADRAAKAAGWQRYTILNSDPPVYCECRDNDVFREEF